MREKDKAVVDAYARAGMSLDTLIRSFPQFNREEISQVFREYEESIGIRKPESGVSINCS